MVKFFFLLNFLKIDNLPFYFSKDYSLRLLILSNILLIIFAIIGNWSIAPIIFIYWFQSVVIGFFVFIRLLTMNSNFIPSNKVNISPNDFNIILAIFFAFHYGFFHVVYFIFILAFSASLTSFSSNSVLFLFDPLFLISLIILFINHAFSEKYNSGDYLEKSAHEIMFSSYARIVPMHLTLVFGTMLVFIFNNHIAMLVLFLILKTIFDIKGHIAKHKNNF